jgi:outer membrane lipoprotein-sorting protein
VFRIEKAVLSLVFTAFLAIPAAAQERDAETIVRDSINHWRGLSSKTELTMVIHRPDWERSMTMVGWTKGEDRSLVRVLEPKKDRGNGTLTIKKNMWSFAPKVNRVIKIPSSMMGQSWMGSDFSNKDIARADDVLDDYAYTLLTTEVMDGVEVYEIEAVPHEDAAIVWGKEVMTITAEHIVMQHRFYDQDGELVKTLQTLEVADMGGRRVAKRQRMGEIEVPDEWTEIIVESVEYGLELSDSLFTQSNLRNPRE